MPEIPGVPRAGELEEAVEREATERLADLFLDLDDRRPMDVESEPQSAFATLEVDSATGRGPIGSVVIEAREVTVRLDGDIDASRVAELASALRGHR